MKDAIIVFLVGTLLAFGFIAFINSVPVCSRPLDYVNAQQLKECTK